MKWFLGIAGVAIAVVVAMVVYGSQIPAETGDQKMAKIKAACTSDFDPSSCQLRETEKYIDKMQVEMQRNEDRAAGN